MHCLVLLGTSADERDRHLQVLAALARTIGLDPAFQAMLFNADSPAHASSVSPLRPQPTVSVQVRA